MSLSFNHLNTKSPLKDLRSFVKQEGLDVSTQVGGRSHRTAQDVYLDIIEAMKEKEQIKNLQRPLFPGKDVIIKYSSPRFKL
jgi:hypothetical protein